MIQVTIRNYKDPNKEVYDYVVCVKDFEQIIFEDQFEGQGSNPFITFRWNKASGEVYGRGPVFNAMAAIKTTNLTVELILQNAQMNISGIYTFEDDGVINPDTITLTPGSLIPVAPNSRGLQALPAAGRFDVAQRVLDDMELATRFADAAAQGINRGHIQAGVFREEHRAAGLQPLFVLGDQIFFTFSSMRQ